MNIIPITYFKTMTYAMRFILGRQYFKPILPLFFFLFLALMCDADAKTAVVPAPQRMTSITPFPVTSLSSPVFIRDFESRMLPVLQSRLQGRQANTAQTTTPALRETDLLLIPRMWDKLSPEFKTTYRKTIASLSPPWFVEYDSPGGHFAISYTVLATDSTDGVDPTDTIGYGNGGDWRVRTHSKNGIPDYIDEVAYALDSAWSMEVDRFGFVKPFSISSDTVAPKFLVSVLHVENGAYAFTYPTDRAKGSTKGWSALIELRNTWKSGGDWARLGYDLHPENALRVTCCHELFHGVQYAMMWNSGNNDGEPLSWIEGSAVLMEELGFDYVNDYLQYAPLFFNNPGISFFVDAGMRPNQEYTNGLLAKFLFEKATGSPRIDFIKSILFTDYNKTTVFTDNLETASQSLCGSSWISLLTRFYTASYYSDTRADTARFLADASLLPKWDDTPDQLSADYTVTKSVGPFGMGNFSFSPASAETDTMFGVVECEKKLGETSAAGPWAGSCIVRENGRPDSIFSLPFDNSGTSSFQIHEWKSKAGALVILTNGSSTLVRKAVVSDLSCPVTYRAGDFTILPATAPDDRSFAAAALSARADLHCPLTTRSIPDSVMVVPRAVTAVSAFFKVNFPAFWGANASIAVTLGVRASHVHQLSATLFIKSDSLRLCHWNDSTARWDILTGARFHTGDTLRWTIDSAHSGVYTVLAPEFTTPVDSSGGITVFPNPARLSQANGAPKFGMHFKGSTITDVRIYTLSGALVCDSKTNKNVFLSLPSQPDETVWRLVNGAGKPVSPGCYSAALFCRDPLTDQTTSKRFKVLVFP
jgi:hypothetical protein